MEKKMEWFEDFDRHLLEDKRPSEYFNQKIQEQFFRSTYPFTLLSKLQETPQSETHHPEGNVWNHTMMVVDNAAQSKGKSEDPRVFMWSALLHDLGKAPTTKIRANGKITSYDHDKVGQGLAIQFLREMGEEEEFIKRVSIMVRWHMQVLFVVNNLPFADIDAMLSEVSIDEIALLSICDRLGRGKLTPEKKKEEEKNVKLFIEKCRSFHG